MGYEGDLEFDGDVKKIRHCLYKCAASHPTMIIKDIVNADFVLLLSGQMDII